MSLAHNMDRPERRGVSKARTIQAAKEKVATIALADLLCGPGKMRRVGENWTARCPLPDHEDRSPSFVVYPETNSWFCYGCRRGGDVIELARYAWGYEKSEVGSAAAMLLMEYGYEVPQRPPSWFAKQQRQAKTRHAVEQTKQNIVRRRLFRHLILPLIDTIEDKAEHARELERAWSEFERLAR